MSRRCCEKGRSPPQNFWGWCDRYYQSWRKVATALRKGVIYIPEVLGRCARYYQKLRHVATALRGVAIAIPEGLGCAIAIIGSCEKLRRRCDKARSLSQKAWGRRDRYYQKMRKVEAALRKVAIETPEGLRAVRSLLSEVAERCEFVAKWCDPYPRRHGGADIAIIRGCGKLRRRCEKARSPLSEVAKRCGGVAGISHRFGGRHGAFAIASQKLRE